MDRSLWKSWRNYFLLVALSNNNTLLTSSLAAAIGIRPRCGRADVDRADACVSSNQRPKAIAAVLSSSGSFISNQTVLRWVRGNCARARSLALAYFSVVVSLHAQELFDFLHNAVRITLPSTPSTSNVPPRRLNASEFGILKVLHFLLIILRREVLIRSGREDETP